MEEIYISAVDESSDIEALEDLIVDDDLGKLEGLTAGFNIFESTGV